MATIGPIKVNPADYHVKYWCGAVHWINAATGKEETVYIDKNTFILKSDPMEIETKLLVYDSKTEERTWHDFTIDSRKIEAYYSIELKTTRIVTSVGEYEIGMSYSELKKILAIAKNHESIIQLN